MYKVKMFFWRIKRAFLWGRFIFKQKYIDDYAITIEVINKILLETADYFEKTNITTTSSFDAGRMRLAAKLLDMYKEEYYSDQLRMKYVNYGFHNARSKNKKCLELACKIISQNMGGWWQ